MCHLCPHVKICCFCYSLRTGSFIIGWIYLVLSIIGFLASIFVSLFLLSRSDVLLDKHCDCSGLGRTDYEWEVCQKNCNMEMSNRYATNTFMWYNISDLILSVALLVGVAGNVPVLLLVFVYGFNIVFLVPSLQRTRSVNTCLLWIFPIRHLCCSLAPDRVGFHIILLYSRVQSVQNDGECRQVLDGRPRFGLHLTSQIF